MAGLEEVMRVAPTEVQVALELLQYSVVVEEVGLVQADLVIGEV